MSKVETIELFCTATVPLNCLVQALLNYGAPDEEQRDDSPQPVPESKIN